MKTCRRCGESNGVIFNKIGEYTHNFCNKCRHIMMKENISAKIYKPVKLTIKEKIDLYFKRKIEL